MKTALDDRLLTLSEATADEVAERIKAKPPSYRRSDLEMGWVHLGGGNFFKGFLGNVADLLASRGDMRWGITVVSLKDGKKKIEQLRRQDGIYVLSEASYHQFDNRIIGSVREAYTLGDDRAAVDARLDEARVITLTITRDGLYYVPGEGKRDLANDPDIIWDLSQPKEPVTAIGLLVSALRRRMRRWKADPSTAGMNGTGRHVELVVVSCDNVPRNGTLLEERVHEVAELQGDHELAVWISHHVVFPNTMVDRIVSNTSHATSEWLESRGVIDRLPVTCEPHWSFVIGGGERVRAVLGDWEDVGVKIVDDDEVMRYEELKLLVVNGSHMLAAVFGAALGIEKIHEAVTTPQIRELLRERVEELKPVLDVPEGVLLDEYFETTLRRFGNYSLLDTVSRVGRDTSLKMRAYVLLPLARQIEIGSAFYAAAFIVAAWIWNQCILLSGAIPTVQISDHLGARMRADRSFPKSLIDAGRNTALLRRAMGQFHEVFPEQVRDSREFVEALALAIEKIGEHGIAHELSKFDPDED